jgi:hypothetical protein
VEPGLHIVLQRWKAEKKTDSTPVAKTLNFFFKLKGMLNGLKELVPTRTIRLFKGKTQLPVVAEGFLSY